MTTGGHKNTVVGRGLRATRLGCVVSSVGLIMFSAGWALWALRGCVYEEPLIHIMRRLAPPPTELPSLNAGYGEWQTDPRSWRKRDSTWLTPSYGMKLRHRRARAFVNSRYQDVTLRHVEMIMDFDGRGSVGLANRIDVFDIATSPSALRYSNEYDNWSHVVPHDPFVEVSFGRWGDGTLYEYGSSQPFLTYNGRYSAAVSTGTAWARFLLPIWPEDPDEGKYAGSMERVARKNKWSKLDPECSATLCVVWRNRKRVLDHAFVTLVSDVSISTYSTSRGKPSLQPQGDAESYHGEVLAIPEMSSAPEDWSSPPFAWKLELQRGWFRDTVSLSGIVRDDVMSDVRCTSGIQVVVWRGKSP